jgi:hypothetical protein
MTNNTIAHTNNRFPFQSLGGNCKTTLLVAASPSPFNADETIAALRCCRNRFSLLFRRCRLLFLMFELELDLRLTSSIRSIDSRFG